MKYLDNNRNIDLVFKITRTLIIMSRYRAIDITYLIGDVIASDSEIYVQFNMRIGHNIGHSINRIYVSVQSFKE